MNKKKPRLLDLRPTQFVLGMREVEDKVVALRRFGKKERLAWCREHEIPVVVGPARELYLIDHHHFVRACWETGTEDYSVNVVKDLHREPEKDFWNIMVQNGWLYLHDQFGLGPHPPSALPIDIRFLADDPFRSLTWEAIEKGWIRKETLPFFEFQWAAFFRRNMNGPLHSKSDFKVALRSVKALVKSRAARGLPGYRRR